jgi:two-component system response regulator FixJ
VTDTAPKRIFVVEDDDAVRTSTRVLLEALGYAVRAFASAEAFLAATQGREADCLLFDYQLPGMTGVDLLQLLRARQISTPVIVISASGNDVLARVARTGVLVLRKPVAGDVLAQHLDDLFGKK